MSAVATLVGLVLVLGFGLVWARARLVRNDDALVDAIDALLPQSQCAQCGYPGCRPYAEALAGGAAPDLCRPGGQATFEALKALLGRDAGPFTGEFKPAPGVAKIREAECIGCFLCIQACPVDAIVGAPGFLHQVLEAHCTGCELCLPACPVDCIELMPVAAEPANRRKACPPPATGADAPCIGCNRCEDVCPETLAPQQMLRLTRSGHLERADVSGLDRCIECRLCDRACPSGIPLAGLFGNAKNELAQRLANQAKAASAKARFVARTARLAEQEALAQARRAQRLASAMRREW